MKYDLFSYQLKQKNTVPKDELQNRNTGLSKDSPRCSYTVWNCSSRNKGFQNCCKSETL